MKASTLILIIIITVLLMMFAGWLTFNAYSGGASVTIDTNEIKKDTDKAIEKGEEFLDNAKEKGDKLINGQDNEESKPEEESDTLNNSDSDNANNSDQETDNPVLTE